MLDRMYVILCIAYPMRTCMDLSFCVLVRQFLCVCIPILFICAMIYLSSHSSDYLCVCSLMCRFIYVSDYLCVCLFMSLFIYGSVH